MKTAAARHSGRIKMPEHIPPMLAVLSEMPADDSQYSFEFKWDGIRALCYFNGRNLQFESRNLLDLTAQYPELHSLKKALTRPIILDGEIVALNKAGRPDFSLLQNRMRRTEERVNGTFPIQYILFDILFQDGRDLMPLSYLERRSYLEALKLEAPNWRISPSRRGNGKQIWEIAKQHQLEGVMAKENDSPYEPGRRSPSWLKIKQTLTEELLIGGWVRGKGEITEGVGALLLGYYDKSARFHYAGKIGSGMSYEERLMLKEWFELIPLDESPFEETDIEKGAIFCDPKYVVSVEFRGWTPGGKLRQGTYLGIRSDKDPEEIVLTPDIQSP